MEVEPTALELEVALIELGLSLVDRDVNVLDQLQPWRVELDLVARELGLFFGLNHVFHVLFSLVIFLMYIPYLINILRRASLY